MVKASHLHSSVPDQGSKSLHAPPKLNKYINKFEDHTHRVRVTQGEPRQDEVGPGPEPGRSQVGAQGSSHPPNQSRGTSSHYRVAAPKVPAAHLPAPGLCLAA